jgi:hypothetical protein
MNRGSGSRNKIVLDKTRYFSEMLWRLKMSVLLPTALAALTDVAEGLALGQ